MYRILSVALLAASLAACGGGSGGSANSPGSTSGSTSSDAGQQLTGSSSSSSGSTSSASTTTTTASSSSSSSSSSGVTSSITPTHWQPVSPLRWQIQFSGTLDTSVNADVYDIDLFDTSAATIQALHQQGRHVICYFSAGSYENWRPDAASFPLSVLGLALDGWPGEQWLDISNIAALAPIMEARLNLAVSKSCDGVDPDNVDTYTQNSGFTLSFAQQITYNTFLATQAHARGLAIGLKNDLDQVPQLVGSFDYQINESCYDYNECSDLSPFVNAGKPVFSIEYAETPNQFCPIANQYGFDAIYKDEALDASVTYCL